MPDHSPELWEVAGVTGPEDPNGIGIKHAIPEPGRSCGRGQTVVWPGAVHPQDAHRIVACVNALAGVPIEVIESGVVKNLLDGFLSMPVTVDAQSSLAPIVEGWLNYIKKAPLSTSELLKMYEKAKQQCCEIGRHKKAAENPELPLPRPDEPV